MSAHAAAPPPFRVDAAGMREAATRARDYPGEVLLRTHRLVLRGLRFRDLSALSALHREESVRALLLEPVPRTALEIAGLVILANRTAEQHPGLGVWHASDHAQRFVGLFSLMPLADGRGVELGARLLPWAAGRLYSLEGSRALRDHAFTTLGLECLHGFCDPGNHAVPALFHRLGFEARGQTIHFDRPALGFVLERAAWQRRPAPPAEFPR